MPDCHRHLPSECAPSERASIWRSVSPNGRPGREWLRFVSCLTPQQFHALLNFLSRDRFGFLSLSAAFPNSPTMVTTNVGEAPIRRSRTQTANTDNSAPCFYLNKNNSRHNHITLFDNIILICISFDADQPIIRLEHERA